MFAYVLLSTQHCDCALILGIKKKVVVGSNKRNCRDLAPWTKSVSNHMWWSCSSCEGDPTVSVERDRCTLLMLLNIVGYEGVMLSEGVCAGVHGCTAVIMCSSYRHHYPVM